jgi:hypothetical protein
MASLLDVFGTGGGESLSLLGMTPEDIKRAQADAQAQALYALAGRLFQGGKTGQSIAQGLQMGQQAYQQAMKGQMADRLQMAQLQQMQQQQREAAEAKARQAAVQKLIPQAMRPAVPGMPAQMVEEEGRYLGETPAVAAQPARFDLQAIAPQLMTTPEGLTALANLSKAQEALQPKLQTLKPEEQLGYMQDGRFVTVAQGAPKPAEPVKPPSAVLEYEYAKSQGYKGTFDQFKQLNKPTTTVNVGDKSFASAFGQGVAQSVENTFTAAQGAVSTLARIETLKPLVSDAKVFSGPLSGAQQVAIRIADSFGVAGANQQEKLKNTAVAMQQLAGLELNAAEAMKGQGAITENERSLIKRAAGGDLLTMTAGEVSSLLGALEKTSKFKISAHQRNVDRLRKNPQLSELVQFYEMPTVQETPVTIPADSAAQAAAELARRRRGQ